MTILFAVAVALLGLFVAVVHSAIGERRIFRPLAREERRGVMAGPVAFPIMRAVWHLPSVAWALLGLGVLAARLDGGEVIVTVIAATMFAVSGAANLIALRLPHFGGLLLLAMAGLVVADWAFAV